MSRLHASEVLVIASNTGHIIAPAVAEEFPQLELLHIGDCVAAEARRRGYQTLGLLGTKPTMEGTWLSARLGAAGLAV